MIPRLQISFPFRNQFTYWFGKLYAPKENEYLLNHARSGIVLALRSSLPNGGRVGVIAYNCDTVANAILNANCEPIFVDVTEDLHIDVDSLNQDIATSVIKANCRYLEDKWLVSINPIIVTYKNEIDKSKVQSGESMFSRDAFGVYKYSTWVNAYKSISTDADVKLPPINIQGTKLEEKLQGSIEFPSPSEKSLNALAGVYDLTAWKQGQWKPIDPTKNKDRRETDVRGKFMKVRIRYSGEELAIIDFLNTIYQISFA